ncbi:hypothetical protein FGIG_03798 [Fasciola gigantica]|uniref:Uncharacterized protein n=1 Tax=Fasciola gigantica TaxID=46835 RepID=A0A504YNY3_FASGI|nr:hypothetical protein FGIG_03798 [Fasciola gigantica]
MLFFIRTQSTLKDGPIFANGQYSQTLMLKNTRT